MRRRERNEERTAQMASLLEHVWGSRETKEPMEAAASVTQLHDILDHQKSFHKHMSALSSRTALAPEDVMAEAVRFADRHQEAFHDFIYKGDLAKPAQQGVGTGQVNTVIAMTVILGVLIALIVMLGS
jgi:hypothetical protein